MKKIVFLLVMCLMWFSLIGKAQDTIGMGGSLPYGYKDTVQIGEIDTFSVSVKNYSSNAFNDTLTVVGAVRDTANASILHIVGSYTTYNAVSLLPYDSITIPLTAVYNIGIKSYHAGINVIVIWPVAQNAKTVDSLEFIVYIIDDNGINELDLRQFIKAYPNPTTDHFTIENNSKTDIEEVRIYGLDGKLIDVANGRSKINTENWTKGIYMIDIILNNHQKYSIRIIKQ